MFEAGANAPRGPDGKVDDTKMAAILAKLRAPGVDPAKAYGMLSKLVKDGILKINGPDGKPLDLNSPAAQMDVGKRLMRMGLHGVMGEGLKKATVMAATVAPGNEAPTASPGAPPQSARAQPETENDGSTPPASPAAGAPRKAGAKKRKRRRRFRSKHGRGHGPSAQGRSPGKGRRSRKRPRHFAHTVPRERYVGEHIDQNGQKVEAHWEHWVKPARGQDGKIVPGHWEQGRPPGRDVHEVPPAQSHYFPQGAQPTQPQQQSQHAPARTHWAQAQRYRPAAPH